MDDLYIRQELINLQIKLAIAVIGLGGVGFWTAKFLAMSGVKQLFLFDDDNIEIHNLNRLDLSIDSLGKNKAMISQDIIEELRPECQVRHYPLRFRESSLTDKKLDWLIDCTDNFASQQLNERVAKNRGIKYKKLGYDGTHIGMYNKPASWGKEIGNYTVTPSWVVPAAVIAALGVASILKYTGTEELACDISDFYTK